MGGAGEHLNPNIQIQKIKCLENLNAWGLGFLGRGMGRGGGTYKLHIGHAKDISTGGGLRPPPVDVSLKWLMCSLYVPPHLPIPLTKHLTHQAFNVPSISFS